jgi:hypothetical protein
VTRLKHQIVNEPIYFGGQPEPKVPREVPEAPDLSSMSFVENHQLFLLWLSIVWFHSAEIPRDPMELVSSDFSVKNLERQFRAYSVTHGLSALRRGCTPEELWYTNHLMLRRSYTLLVSLAKRRQPYERVVRIAFLSPRGIIRALKLALRLDRAFMTLTHDGRTGHCILMRAESQNTGEFHFHDPWPSRSLLCAENNEAGVDAKPSSNGAGWLISPSDLEKVVFGVIMDTEVWESVAAQLENDAAGTLRAWWSRKRNWLVSLIDR